MICRNCSRKLEVVGGGYSHGYTFANTGDCERPEPVKSNTRQPRATGTRATVKPLGVGGGSSLARHAQNCERPGCIRCALYESRI